MEWAFDFVRGEDLKRKQPIGKYLKIHLGINTSKEHNTAFSQI